MIEILLSPVARSVAGAAILIASFLTWLLVHDARVEQKAVAKIETANDKAVATVDRARAASRAAGVRKRDRYTVD